MRITHTMISSTLLANLTRNRERLAKYQAELSTGRRINIPSHDPEGSSRLLRLRLHLYDNDQYQRNIGDARDGLVVTESALQDVEDLLGEVRSLALRAADGSQGEESRQSMANQVDQSLERLIQLANQRLKGGHIFGGTQTLTAPYTASREVTEETFTASYDSAVSLQHADLVSGSVTVSTYVEGTDYTVDYDLGTITVLSAGSMSDGTDYEIDYETRSTSSVIPNPAGLSGEISRAIGEGLTMGVNTSGDDVFTAEVDLFSTLIGLRDSLRRNDLEGIRGTLTPLEDGIDQVSRATALVGSKITRLDTALEQLKEEHLTLEDLISGVRDADMAEAIVQFQMEDNAYRAALKAGAMILQPSLLDFLR